MSCEKLYQKQLEEAQRQGASTVIEFFDSKEISKIHHQLELVINNLRIDENQSEFKRREVKYIEKHLSKDSNVLSVNWLNKMAWSLYKQRQAKERENNLRNKMSSDEWNISLKERFDIKYKKYLKDFEKRVMISFELTNLYDRNENQWGWNKNFESFLSKFSTLKSNELRKSPRKQIERLNFFSNANECASCHATIDSLGLYLTPDNQYALLFTTNSSEYGFDYMTIDHIIPKSKGGVNDYSNYQMLCSACNQKKADNISQT